MQLTCRVGGWWTELALCCLQTALYRKMDCPESFHRAVKDGIACTGSAQVWIGGNQAPGGRLEKTHRAGHRQCPSGLVLPVEPRRERTGTRDGQVSGEKHRVGRRCETSVADRLRSARVISEEAGKEDRLNGEALGRGLRAVCPILQSVGNYCQADVADPVSLVARFRKDPYRHLLYG